MEFSTRPLPSMQCSPIRKADAVCNIFILPCWKARKPQGGWKSCIVCIPGCLVQIENGETYFKTTLQAGGIMDVVEEYPWSGEIVQHKRRDKRAGNHTGRVAQTDEGPQLQ